MQIDWDIDDDHWYETRFYKSKIRDISRKNTFICDKNILKSMVIVRYISLGFYQPEASLTESEIRRAMNRVKLNVGEAPEILFAELNKIKN